MIGLATRRSLTGERIELVKMPKQDPKQQIEDIRESARARNGITLDDWEEDFLVSIEDLLDREVKLSQKQLEKLEEIWDRV